MKFLQKTQFTLGIVALLCFVFQEASAQAPSWSEDFPVALPAFSGPQQPNGAYRSNLKIRVSADQPGTAFFVTYQTPPANAPTASELVTLAQSPNLPPGAVGKNFIDLVLADATYSKDVPGLPMLATPYTTYVVVRNGAGQFSDVRTLVCYLKVSGRQVTSSFFYLEYLPPDYNTTTNDYPLMIFLHGLGERGDGVNALVNVSKHGPPFELAKGQDLPFIIISPQCPTTTVWEDQTENLHTFIESIKTAYPRADPNRIYLTGLSLGGIGTWKYARTYPGELAAIAPIAGRGSTSGICVLDDMPIWTFHDDPDDVVLSSYTKNLVAAIKACPDYSNKLRVTYYKNKFPNGSPENRHDAWKTAYSQDPSPPNTTILEVDESPAVPEGMTLYTWLLQHSLNAAPTANAGTDIEITPPPNSTFLSGSGSDTDGTIITYAWTQQSGPNQATIQNATSPTATVGNLITGTYSFRLTVTDDDGVTDTDDVQVVVNPANQLVWHSYHIQMQSDVNQQAVVTSTNGTVKATLEFYQSSDDNGVQKGTAFTTYVPGTHLGTGEANQYWITSAGVNYPFAGKSIHGRGAELGEGNVPAPTGVLDLQLHPPSTAKSVVCAFTAPAKGTYTINGLGVRRVLSQAGTVVYRAMNQEGQQLQSLIATPDQDWVLDPASYSLGELDAGEKIYFAVGRDGVYYYDFTEVTWSISMIPSASTHTWNSYDIAMQSNPLQQGRVTSDNALTASLEFYRSSNDYGVNKISNFTTFTPANHTNSNSAASHYWADGTGDIYPFAGKSIVGRGLESGEGNVPQPPNVFDLQLHPPSNAKSTVCAFIAPWDGTYTISGLGVRRVSSEAGTARYRAFSPAAQPLASLVATPDQDWVLDNNSYSLGTLTAGQKIYFAVDRDGVYYFDFTEVAWKITYTSSNGNAMGRIVTNTPPATEVVGENEEEVVLFPNRVKHEIHLSGLRNSTEVVLYDMTGRQVDKRTLPDPNGTADLDATALRSGMYYMIIRTDGRVLHRKFQKE
ncbi:T9SS type A sorting domain-containing protein [Chryseolinea sp. H1M3-3]|uniref:PKD domain-containing protein n=1 Tax=Chryseolinea sp. H1M3-3 TaxID=3034144 RepID=UPI0023EDDDC6|nr:T9SS type A sorting domain-containing protein [Chryseolinea sp. H1M3-3]